MRCTVQKLAVRDGSSVEPVAVLKQRTVCEVLRLYPRRVVTYIPEMAGRHLYTTFSMEIDTMASELTAWSMLHPHVLWSDERLNKDMPFRRVVVHVSWLAACSFTQAPVS